VRLSDQRSGVVYGGLVSELDSGDTSRMSGTVLQDSPTSVGNHVQVCRAKEAYTSSPQADETWTVQEASLICDIAPLTVGVLPDHVLSPSASSSYNLEDGIFEPGSAYQNLFQSLRSHVFRTAQIENDTSERSHVPTSRWDASAARHSDTLHDQPTRISGGATRSSDAADARTFELPPAQEYLLWKAWTEEVSVWVCDALDGSRLLG